MGTGCHTMNVRAWDNAGQPSPDATYGPICYDITPPVTTITLSGQLIGTYYVAPLLVTLTATDDLSGVAGTLYQIDTGSWQSYNGPVTVTALGQHTITFYSVDNAGNVEAPHIATFWGDQHDTKRADHFENRHRQRHRLPVPTAISTVAQLVPSTTTTACR